MRSRPMDHRPPIIARSIALGGLGTVTVAEAVVVGVMMALVIMVWRYVV